jgi:hypothetical protein
MNEDGIRQGTRKGGKRVRKANKAELKGRQNKRTEESNRNKTRNGRNNEGKKTKSRHKEEYTKASKEMILKKQENRKVKYTKMPMLFCGQIKCKGEGRGSSRVHLYMTDCRSTAVTDCGV